MCQYYPWTVRCDDVSHGLSNRTLLMPMLDNIRGTTTFNANFHFIHPATFRNWWLFIVNYFFFCKEKDQMLCGNSQLNYGKPNAPVDQCKSPDNCTHTQTLKSLLVREIGKDEYCGNFHCLTGGKNVPVLFVHKIRLYCIFFVYLFQRWWKKKRLSFLFHTFWLSANTLKLIAIFETVPTKVSEPFVFFF